ncbi:winged helix-turn-helix transcriptional regulator [Nitrosopumilus ureiphilus]|nr:winged helix-turn-helix transcriptional regulator [Nitrosopumilus ureiphilus]
MDEILESPKDKILDFITNNPSSHLRKIKNNLGFSMGTVQYYLTMLEREGKIKSTKTKFYKNYYHINESDDEILSVLNLDSPRNIVIFLIQHEPSTHQEIAQGIGLSSSTISWHMKRLIELQVVQTEYSGKYTVYRLRDRNNVLSNLNKCKSTVWNAMISNMTDVFSAFDEK